MVITSAPTDLNVYYCENCHGIVATTDLSLLSLTSLYHCPFCQEESLVMLSKEDYEINFDLTLFPSPQDEILANFFQHANNTIELLSVFEHISSFKHFGLQLGNFQSLNYVHIFIDPDLKITIQVENVDKLKLEIISRDTDSVLQSSQPN